MPSILYNYAKKAYAKAELSQSTIDPFSGLLSGLINRQFLLRASPKDGAGAIVPFDIGSAEYVSQPADTPFKVFPPYLRTPFNFSIGLDPASFTGFASMSANVNNVANLGGVNDSILDLDWLGAAVNTYIGPPEPAPLSDFTQILKGYAVEATKDGLHSILINGRDASFPLQTKILQKNRYRGTGAALRLNGTSQYGSCTLACPVGAVTFTGTLRLNANITSQRQVVGYRNGTSAGNRLVDVGRIGTNRIGWAVRNDAATQFFCDAPATHPYIVGNLSDFAAVLDPANNQMRLYINRNNGSGWELVTTTATTGTFNTVLSNYVVGTLPDSPSLYYQGDLDEFRIYSSALTTTTLPKLEREGSGVEATLYSYYKFNEGSGTSAANTVAGKPALTLTGSPAWVGSLEGDQSLANTVKTVAVGVRRQVEPKWVDTQRLVVQWHDGPMQALTAVRDSGDPITFGSDVSDIYSVTPTAGTYNTCLAKGLSRFGSPIIGTPTGDVKGANGGTLGYAETTSTIHRKLLVDYGGQHPIDAIDDLSFDSLEALNPAVTGEYFNEEITVYEACNVVLRSINAWGGANRVGVHLVGRIDDPALLTPSVNWTQDDLLMGGEFRASGLDQSIPVKEVVIGYRPYSRTLTADEVAGAVSLVNRVDFGEKYRFVSYPVPGANQDGIVLTLYTSLDSQEDAQEELERIAPFLARAKEALTVQPKEGALTYFLGTIVSLLIQERDHADNLVERFGGIKNYVMLQVSESINETSETVRCLLLG